MTKCRDATINSWIVSPASRWPGGYLFTFCDGKKSRENIPGIYSRIYFAGWLNDINAVTLRPTVCVCMRCSPSSILAVHAFCLRKYAKMFYDTYFAYLHGWMGAQEEQREWGKSLSLVSLSLWMLWEWNLEETCYSWVNTRVRSIFSSRFISFEVILWPTQNWFIIYVNNLGAFWRGAPWMYHHPAACHESSCVPKTIERCTKQNLYFGKRVAGDIYINWHPFLMHASEHTRIQANRGAHTLGRVYKNSTTTPYINFRFSDKTKLMTSN